MSITPETICHHLTHLPQRRSLNAALELFKNDLGYRYADELPLPTRNRPDGIQRLVRGNAAPPILPPAFKLRFGHIQHIFYEAATAAGLVLSQGDNYGDH